MKQMKKIVRCMMPIMALMLVVGCAGYQLGNTLPVDIRNIYVPTFVNNTAEASMENAATDETIARFQFDGSAKITDKAMSDATLFVTLIDYSTAAVSFEDNENQSANEYRATLGAKVMLIRNSDQSVVMESPRIIGEATFFVSGDLANAKRNAQRSIAEDLAKRIVDAVTQVW